MPYQALKALKAHHVEVARLIALGTPTTEISRLTRNEPTTISVWRRDPLIIERVKKFEELRDAGMGAVGGALAQNATARRLINVTAREILKSAELESVQKVVEMMRSGKRLSQQYTAALEILKLLGYYASEKAGQIVINIAGGDVKELRDGMQRVTIPEPAKMELLSAGSNDA